MSIKNKVTSWTRNRAGGLDRAQGNAAVGVIDTSSYCLFI